MSVDTVKLFRPQAGDIVIVDFNKVNVTQVENAVKDLKVPVIAVHDINTIQIWGMREQVDHSQAVAELQLKLDAAAKENNRLNRIIKDDMIPKPQPVAASTTTAHNQPEPKAVGNLVPKTVPVIGLEALKAGVESKPVTKETTGTSLPHPTTSKDVHTT